MIRKILDNMTAKAREQRRAELHRSLLRREAKVGGQLFGTIPVGVRREFFCLDRHTWIWHEEWTDEGGSHKIKTTRYDIRPNTILKAQDGQPYQVVQPKEAYRFYQAVQSYRQRVKNEVYSFI